MLELVKDLKISQENGAVISIPKQEAELAKEKTNGYKLDRAHVFAVNMFDEIEKFMKVPDEWAPPETKLYTSGVLLRTTATSMVDNLLLNLILPQAICTRYGLTVGATMAPFVQFLLWLFFPIAYPISKNIQKGHSSIERGKQRKKCVSGGEEICRELCNMD